jgi:hypothetical protein
VPDVLAILEDDPRRVAAMRACAADVLPNIDIVIFEDASAMIDWLGQNLADVVFISLDHDLPMDRGMGRQVADHLAALAPTCPVIVHSSNELGASGMYFELKRAGWPCKRVYPRDDVAWVGTAWKDELERFVKAGWIGRPQE